MMKLRHLAFAAVLALVLSVGIVACIKDGEWVFCGASGCKYLDGTVAQ